MNKDVAKRFNILERVDVRYLENDTPQQIMRGGFNKKGRPRTFPLNIEDPKDLKDILNKPHKDFTDLEKRAYNRLASRNTYADEVVRYTETETSKQYKEKLGKKLKNFTKDELKEYNRIAQKESRIKEKLAER